MMVSGLLWFDDDPRKDPGRKIGEAAERYLRRFGFAPTVCRVHCPPQAAGSGEGPSSLPLPALSSGSPLVVVADRRVRPHHFWLGQADSEPAGAEPADSVRTPRR